MPQPKTWASPPGHATALETRHERGYASRRPPTGGPAVPSRTIAIGDVHGCSTALAALLDAIGPVESDTVVTLGDYIDRGPDSKGVIEQLIALEQRCRLVPLLGNHEEMILGA